jgi:two-component system phosphate regulon response regulator PhoB
MASILVIDDDPDIADLVALRMKLDGHEVEVVRDGSAGLQHALQHRPDVVIIDWTLPGLTGPQVCTQLRAQLPPGTVRTILLTGLPLTESQAIASGADEFVPKPFSPRALSQRVSAALARRDPSES